MMQSDVEQRCMCYLRHNDINASYQMLPASAFYREITLKINPKIF